jgi:hypothetical protein
VKIIFDPFYDNIVIKHVRIFSLNEYIYSWDGSYWTSYLNTKVDKFFRYANGDPDYFGVYKSASWAYVSVDGRWLTDAPDAEPQAGPPVVTPLPFSGLLLLGGLPSLVLLGRRHRRTRCRGR